MKQPQWMTTGVAIFLIGVIFIFARTVPEKKIVSPAAADAAMSMPGELSTDTILHIAKSQLTVEQAGRITALENTISRGAVKQQQLDVYHQLVHIWGDSLGFFPVAAWYQAEAARLENSEKSLTFAAHLLLSNVLNGHDQDAALTRWEALQAKDLFERSLRINPANDSSRIGIGACFMFGNISTSPMEGIKDILEVVNRDSTNVYGQMMLVQGALFSNQLDKAISRLHTICRLQPDNTEAIFLLADVYERSGNKTAAAEWYRKSLLYIKRPDVRAAIEKRITDLTK